MNDIVTINGYNFFLIFQCNKFVCGRASMMMTRLFCFIGGCKKREQPCRLFSCLGGRWDSNPRPSEPQSGTLTS